MLSASAILIPIAVVASLGLVFAVLLSYLAKRFEVKVDPLVNKLYHVLAQINCGACGYPNCMSYAEAMAKGDAEGNLCSPGGEFVADEVAEILGKKAQRKVRRVAKLICGGGDSNAWDAFVYRGVPTCRAATLVRGGHKACTYGCLGFGDCERVCPVNAITMKGGLPVIDREKCVSCERCVRICPKNVIVMVPYEKEVFVECVNRDKGALTRKVCKVGCIACRRCEKTCPVSAIHVIDNCAVIDYSKCVHSGKCVEICPVNIIRQHPVCKKGKATKTVSVS